MLIAKISGGNVVKLEDYRSMFPNTSFPASGPDADFMAEHDLMRVTVWRDHDQELQKLVSCSPVVENGTVYTVAVEDLTAEELAARLESKASGIRTQRNQLLAACDWTQGRDIADAIAAPWAVYRQALRDITEQDSFPNAVTWPTQPE